MSQIIDTFRPASLLFFEKIAELTTEQWREYWKTKNASEVQSEMERHYVYEVSLVAQKVQAKIDLMSLGSAFFKLAILFLAFLVAGIFSSDLGLIRTVTFLAAVSLSITFAFESRVRPPKGSHTKKLMVLIPIWVVVVIVLISLKLS